MLAVIDVLGPKVQRSRLYLDSVGRSNLCQQGSLPGTDRWKGQITELKQRHLLVGDHAQEQI